MYRKTFASPWSDTEEHNGKAFEVLGIIAEPDEHHDAEVLPMYRIRLEDGTELEAWPEEVIADDAGQ